MKRLIVTLISIFLLVSGLWAQADSSPAGSSEEVVSEIRRDEGGLRLFVKGEPFEVKGVVWSYIPIGENYTYNLWDQPEDIIKKMIDRDARLMKDMGVNAIRVFSDVPPKWITYFYRQYGIYTIVNPLFGRYGVSARGIWYPLTDYSDKYSREVIKRDTLEVVETYKDVPGVLMFLFGNENNYGLEWDSGVIQDLPVGQRSEVRAGYLYSLFEEAIAEAKQISTAHPYGIVNGDIQYLNLIEELVPSLDVLGVNTYRGGAAQDLFYQSVESLGVPIVYTELGAEAWNAATQQEDQFNQARYIFEQWREIYQQSYGKGKSQNVIGGFVFEWMDEWWKHLQTENLEVHDTEGTWSNGAYAHDAVPGVNNMQEEWFGIVAQSPRKDDGIHRRIPRAAYYLLQELWKLPLYDSSSTDVADHFAAAASSSVLARGEANVIKEEEAWNPINLQGFTARVEGRIAADDQTIAADWMTDAAFTNGQELTLTLGLQPLDNLTGFTTLKVWANPILPAWGEAPKYLGYDDTTGETDGHINLYAGEFTYSTDLFDLTGYYRSGRPDWMLHGDAFNLMPEAWDRLGMDKDGSDAPLGLQLDGKQALQGLRLAIGPEVYWGALPLVAANYYREFTGDGVTGSFGLMYLEEFAAREDAYPGEVPGRRASLSGSLGIGPYLFAEAGVLFSGSESVGETFYQAGPAAEPGGGENGSDIAITEDTIDYLDTLAFKVRLGTDIIRYTRIWAQYLQAGLVAAGNPMIPRSGFQVADSGAGNRREINAGARFIYGDFTAEGIFRWRKPLVDPMTAVGSYTLRSNLTDPFAVYWNRETIEAEVVATFDPEGATYFHDWNVQDRENAKIAASLSFLYTFYAGPTDAGVFKAADGAWFAFPSGLPEASGLWTLAGKVYSNPLPGLKINFDGRIGTQQSTGESERLVNFIGLGLDMRYRNLFIGGGADFSAWGPEVWHRQFNITYPLQWHGEIAYGFDTPSMMTTETRIGLAAAGRSFGTYSADDEPGEGSLNKFTLYVDLTY